MINLIDILLLLIVAGSLMSGYRRGFILSVLDLVRWLGSLLIALRFYPYLAALLSRLTGWNPVWIPPIAFIVTAIIANLLIGYLEALLLKRLPEKIHFRRSNKALGLLPGLFSGIISAAIVSILLLAVPWPEAIESRVDSSRTVNYLAAKTDQLEEKLAPIFEEATHRTLTNLTVDPGSDKFIELPFKVSDYKPRPDLEARMLVLVNRERRAQGLDTLVADTALTRVARRHSADMFRRGYFSHYTPEGLNPFDRIRAGGIRFRAAGENLALAPTLPIAHQGLMNSPGHRANILQRRFGRVGIGVLQGNGHRLMITQKFRN